MEISATQGDVTRIPADAIVTLINSGGAWFGGVDGAIMHRAGTFYHDQVRQVSSGHLKDGQVIVALGDHHEHSGLFDDVIFVVDDLQRPLKQLVLAALTAAKGRKYGTVAIPALRTGVMRGQVEGVRQAIRAIGDAVREFQSHNRNLNMRVIFVIYDDPSTLKMLAEELALPSQGT